MKRPPNLTESYRIVARRIVANASGPDLMPPHWESYPEIGEYDFPLVLGEVLKLCREINPSDREFGSAYALLEQRTWEEVRGR